ncbi:MAG: hypothetical protein ACOY3L_04020 [Pseudomonadota bacterium]
MNPELLRNLWIEITPSRLAAAPLVLGAILLLIWYVSGGNMAEVSGGALWLYYFIVLMWGTRRAAASLADEVANRTWDSQRMSALGPWAMSWGKLFGATAYVWYGALLCLAVAAVESRQSWRAFLLHPIAGAAAMAVALLVVLLQRGRGRAGGRRTLIAQGLGIAAGFVLSPTGPGLLNLRSPYSRYSMEWYGLGVSPDLFFLVAAAGFLAWALFGIYRAMCADLQKPVWPWAWTAFSLYLIAFLGGFAMPGENALGVDWLMVAVPAAAVLFYVALFADGKDSVRYRWFLVSVRSGDWARAARLMPLWLPSLPLLAGLAVALGIRTDQGDPTRIQPLFYDLLGIANVEVLPATAWAVAAILFALRDLLLVLFLNFGPKSRSPDLAAFIYLAVLYWIVPGILGFLAPGWVQALFLPWPLSGPFVAICAPAAEVVLFAVLAWQRWRALAPRLLAA